jgi:nucleotide-binding universal stress UspA family protein
MTQFNRILVCLDGSEFSERALALAGVLRAGTAHLSLLRVTPGEATDADASAAKSYLEGLRGDRSEAELTTIVRRGVPAEEILAEAEAHDLLVIMTHGRSGPRRWLWGSVAERVVRHCPRPVLLANPRTPEAFACRRILVPLDGSAHADSALPVAQELAKAHQAEVTLFMASWIEPSDNPLATTREHDARHRSMEAALRKQAKPLEAAGVPVSIRAVLRYPAEGILATADQTQADLIVMTTHGRSGLRRWALGSVAEKVLRAASHPVLLVRIDEAQLADSSDEA